MILLFLFPFTHTVNPFLLSPTHLLVRLELVFSLVLPNLVWANEAVVKVRGAVLRGKKVGDPFVGDGEAERSSPLRLRLARHTSTGRKTRASGLKVLCTSRSMAAACRLGSAVASRLEGERVGGPETAAPGAEVFLSQDSR